MGSGVGGRRAVSPVQYLDDSGFLDARRAGRARRADDARPIWRGWRRAARRSSPARAATATPAPARRRSTDFYDSGVRVAVGTDSLASTPDLNVFAELATMRALAPTVPAVALLDSATRQGARALGFDADFGTIEPGKRARLLAVAIPAGVDDVEEYLVSRHRAGTDSLARRRESAT